MNQARARCVVGPQCQECVRLNCVEKIRSNDSINPNPSAQTNSSLGLKTRARCCHSQLQARVVQFAVGRANIEASVTRQLKMLVEPILPCRRFQFVAIIIYKSQSLREQNCRWKKSARFCR
jgi:hypothetical protein